MIFVINYIKNCPNMYDKDFVDMFSQSYLPVSCNFSMMMYSVLALHKKIILGF